MKTILIQPKDEQELSLLSAMLKKMGIEAQYFTDEEKEDLALGKAIEEGMKTENVSKATILESLRR